MAKEYKFRKTFTYDSKRYTVRANTEKEAIMKMANKIRDLEEGRVIISTKMTVKDWASICIKDYKTNIKPITLQNYQSKMNRWIISEIGSINLNDVKPLHCQAVLNKMDGYATDTIRKVHQMINFIFDKAVQNKLIFESPARYLTIPQGTKSTHRAITGIERTFILNVADTSPKYIYFLFMLFCGCRPSEVAEIIEKDIIDIEGEHMLHIRGTKTVNADRIVPIPDYLYCRLPKINPSEYMFKNENGSQLSTGNRNVLWKHFRRDLNIAMGCKTYRNELIPPYPVAEDLVPYCLRHTYCTDLQKKGIDIRTAQYLMGHSDIGLTANIYTHTDHDTLVDVSKILNKKS